MRLPSRLLSLLALPAASTLLTARLALATAEPVLESSAGGYIGTGTLGRDGCLYSPSTDGANGGIRKFTPDGGSILLVAFTGTGGANRGTTPSILTLGRDGNFYGTTFSGGTSGNGTVFRLTPAGQLTTLADFPADSSDPARNSTGGALLARDGNIYGTTSAGGGPNGGGTIFRVSPTGILTTRFSFYNYPGYASGSHPMAPLLEGADGQLYGTTSDGGKYYPSGNPGVNGVAFRFAPDAANGDTFAVLYDYNTFHNLAGRNYAIRFTQLRDGLFYGVSTGGGNGNGGNGAGTIVTVGATGSVGGVCDFSYGIAPPFAATAGCNPQVELTETPDGNAYGTTQGGNFNLGTVFRIHPTTTPSSYQYTLITQQAGIGRLSLGADGNLHGGTYRLRFGPTPLTGDADTANSRPILAGTVNPNGASTLARFEYGASPDALTALTPAQDLGSGTFPATLSAEVTGLAPGTTYYFRARGDNANQFQPQRGLIRSFTTAGTAPAQVTITPEKGGQRVRLRGLAGVPNVIQWSDNLADWQPLAGPVAPDDAGFIEFMDANPNPATHRFYRAATTP